MYIEVPSSSEHGKKIPSHLRDYVGICRLSRSATAPPQIAMYPFRNQLYVSV